MVADGGFILTRIGVRGYVVIPARKDQPFTKPNPVPWSDRRMPFVIGQDKVSDVDEAMLRHQHTSGSRYLPVGSSVYRVS